MKFILKYLKQQRKTVLLFLLCSGVFAAAFAMYHLPLVAVAYPAGICVFLASVFGGAGLIRAVQKHRTLVRLQKLPDDLLRQLSCYQNPEDGDYQALIQALWERESRLQTEMYASYGDMVDYYTTWVHQIKTPIASMRLTLQNEDSLVSRRLSEDLFRIEQYVEMVLTYLRLDSDATDYVFRECDLDGLVRQCLRKFAGQFIGRGIRLQFVPSNKKIVTDEKWLAFVLEQVLSNALKYTRSGSVTVVLEQPLTLCIRDTGMGIAPEDLPRIFDKGYTGYHGRSDKTASGLGLYLCRRICAKLGHRITAESVVGQGTTVRLHLEQERHQAE